MDLSTILALIATYKLPALFIGALLFGEAVIIPAAFLSAQGFISPFTILWVSFFGAMCADTIWFYLAKRLLPWCHQHPWCEKRSQQTVRLMEHMTGKNPFLYLLVSKFLYGVRILSIFYMSLQTNDYWRFIRYNALGSITWLIILISVSWGAGKGFYQSGFTADRIEFVITAIVGTIVLFKFIELCVSKLVQKRSPQ